MQTSSDIQGLSPLLQVGFGHDFGAVTLAHNDIIASLPCALEMCQQRMTNPFARFSWNQVAQHWLVGGNGVTAISWYLLILKHCRSREKACDTLSHSARPLLTFWLS